MIEKPGRKPAKGVTGATRATRIVTLHRSRAAARANPEVRGVSIAEGADVLRGDPATHVIGKPDEKPARRHAPQPPKPGPTARTILASIQLRMQELEPVVREVPELEAALEALRNV
jgi:hypothetical protein